MRRFMTLGLTKHQSGNEIKQDELGRRGNMACKEENKNACRILEGKTEGKRPLG
jgi:hypothetical protein